MQRLSLEGLDQVVLAATLFAHESAGFAGDVSAGFGGDARSSLGAGVGSGLGEESGERGDEFLQQGVGAGLLIGEVPGLVVGDGVAVLGLGGELADPGGHGRVDGRAARAGAASRG